MSLLSDGRKRRPRRAVHWLWLVALGVGVVLVAAAVVVRI